MLCLLEDTYEEKNIPNIEQIRRLETGFWSFVRSIGRGYTMRTGYNKHKLS